MLKISRELVIDKMWDGNIAAATCKSGDTVCFVTRDCYDDSVVSEQGDPLARQYANPATGPLFVEGAEVGDVLKVEILKIETASSGVMRTALQAGAFQGIITERKVRIFNIENGIIDFDDKLKLKTDVMIGVIGTTPENGECVDTETPREHGGNMDCRRIVEGTTLYLPVNRQGAMLSMGDLHARMGDGEVLVCGLECRGEVTVRVSALKDVKLPTPFLSAEQQVMTIQSAQTLEEATILASRKMHEFLVGSCGLDAINAGMLLSLMGNAIVCQIVDPLMTVRMELPVDILNTYGYKLP